MTTLKLKFLITLFLISGAIKTVSAGSVSPYLPVSLSPILENEIERLASLSGISNLTKPYSVATVVLHMEKIRSSHPILYGRLKTALKPYVKKFSVTHLSASVTASQDHHPQTNSRGTYTRNHIAANFRGQWLVKDWLAFQAGGNLTRYADANLEDVYQASGSMLSLGNEWAQMDIGYKDMWLSPFQGAAQLLSTQAQTMPSISLSNNLPLDTFGQKWNYLGFLSQMSRQPVQFRQGEYSDRKKPFIAGLHLSLEMTEWWSVGATRIFQFGGGDRPISLSTLTRAFFDPRGADNDASIEEESGNQIASMSSKMNFDTSVPFTFSLEFAGEDTSNNKEYQLGNSSVSAGLYFPYFFSEQLSFTYEYSDWQVGWYNNNVYQFGYVNEDFVLGNWAMQVQRENGTAQPGTSHFLKTLWQQSNNQLIVASFRYSEHQDVASVDFEPGWELEVDYVMPWQGHVVSFGVYSGKNNFGESFNQLRVSLEL